MIQSLQRRRHGGHDVILFHVLDEAEATFPFNGMVDLTDPDSGANQLVDADDTRADYLEAVLSRPPTRHATWYTHDTRPTARATPSVIDSPTRRSAITSASAGDSKVPLRTRPGVFVAEPRRAAALPSAPYAIWRGLGAGVD